MGPRMTPSAVADAALASMVKRSDCIHPELPLIGKLSSAGETVEMGSATPGMRRQNGPWPNMTYAPWIRSSTLEHSKVNLPGEVWTWPVGSPLHGLIEATSNFGAGAG
jgi:hypothetical protein